MRGAQVAVFVMCFGLAISMLGTLGWFGLAGVQPDSGLETQDAEEELAEPGASSAGSDEFSIVRGAVDTLNVLRSVTTQLDSTLVNLGVPWAIANAIQAVVTVTMALMIVQVIRGVRFG